MDEPGVPARREASRRQSDDSCFNVPGAELKPKWPQEGAEKSAMSERLEAPRTLLLEEALGMADLVRGDSGIGTPAKVEIGMVASFWR